MGRAHGLDHVVGLGDLVAAGGEVELHTGVDVPFLRRHGGRDLFQLALDLHGAHAGQRLDDDVDLAHGVGAGLERVAAVDGADLHGGQHERVREHLLVVLLPLLDRLAHLERLQDEGLGRPLHGHLGPHQAGVADLHAQARGLADNAHVGGDAVIHEIARAHARAAVALAVEAVDLRLLDLAHHARDDDVALELRSGLDEHVHRGDVAGERALHVDQAAAVDPVLGHAGGFGVVEVVHVAVEHQRRPAARPAQRADDVFPSLLHLLVLHLHAQALELAPQVFRHRNFFAGDGDDVGEIAGHFHQMRAVELRQNLLAVHVIEPPQSFSCFNDKELMQYLRYVGDGPSSNTCPRWASQTPQSTSTRRMP